MKETLRCKANCTVTTRKKVWFENEITILKEKQELVKRITWLKNNKM